MSDKYSCINLCVIFFINYIISFIMRNLGMKQYCSVIKLRYFRFFSLTVNLNLFRVNFGCIAKPSFCYP